MYQFAVKLQINGSFIPNKCKSDALCLETENQHTNIPIRCSNKLKMSTLMPSHACVVCVNQWLILQKNMPIWFVLSCFQRPCNDCLNVRDQTQALPNKCELLRGAAVAASSCHPNIRLPNLCTEVSHLSVTKNKVECETHSHHANIEAP